MRIPMPLTGCTGTKSYPFESVRGILPRNGAMERKIAFRGSFFSQKLQVW